MVKTAKKRIIPRKLNDLNTRRRSLRLGAYLGSSMVVRNPSESPPTRKSFAISDSSNRFSNAINTPNNDHDRIVNEEIDTSATRPLSPGTLARFRAEVEQERLNMNDTWITSDDDDSSYEDDDE